MWVVCIWAAHEKGETHALRLNHRIEQTEPWFCQDKDPHWDLVDMVICFDKDRALHWYDGSNKRPYHHATMAVYELVRVN